MAEQNQPKVYQCGEGHLRDISFKSVVKDVAETFNKIDNKYDAYVRKFVSSENMQKFLKSHTGKAVAYTGATAVASAASLGVGFAVDALAVPAVAGFYAATLVGGAKILHSASNTGLAKAFGAAAKAFNKEMSPAVDKHSKFIIDKLDKFAVAAAKKIGRTAGKVYRNSPLLQKMFAQKGKTHG